MRLIFLYFIYLFIFSTSLHAERCSALLYSGRNFADYRMYDVDGMRCVRKANRLIGYRRGEGFEFEFTRENGFWKEYLTETNTYEECLLEQAYKYLEIPQRNCYTNISDLKFQAKDHKYINISPENNRCETRLIPYIEGSYLLTDLNGRWEYMFRLYIFPSIYEDSTYYLYVKMVKTDQRHLLESFDRPFTKVKFCSRQ